MTTLGWVGAGRMGAAMLGRLLDAGTPVRVWNRTASRVQPLVERGAEQATDFEDLRGLDVVVTSLATPADLEEVAGRLAALADPPHHLVDTSTVSVRTTERVRVALGSSGTGFLSAPVSGNPGAVTAGSASFVCSGDVATYTAARPVLETIGVRSTYLGGGVEATVAKLAHNLLLAIVTEGLAEVSVLAERSGVEPAALLAFLNESVLGSAFTRYKTTAIVERDFAPTFTTRGLLKDVELGLAEGVATGTPLALAVVVREALAAAMVQGHGDDDFMSLLVVQERACTPYSTDADPVPSPAEGTDGPA